MSFRRRWRVGEAVARTFEVLRQDGPVSLWFKIVGEVCYRRMWLIHDKLDCGAPPERQITMRSELLREREIGELAPLAAMDETELRARLARQELCFVGHLDGRIVGWRWYGQKVAHVEYLDADLELPAGCVYEYDVFVVSEHRRRGVSISLLAHSRRALRKRGFEVRFSTVMPQNSKAWASTERAPCHPRWVA